MISLLRLAAVEVPDQPVLITEERKVTYSELLQLAESAAAALVDRGISRFAVHGIDVVSVCALLAASSLSGAEPCIYPAQASTQTVTGLRDRLGHETLISSGPARLSGVIDPADLFGHDSSQVAEPAERGTLLILTSGTSGHPQAARHEWSRVLRVAGRISPTPDHRWLLAYGLNQFGGLQVLLHVLSARATLVVGRSLQPRDALDAMRAHGITHASGTPTFWRFLLAEIRADGQGTPDLRQVTLGGEAVPSALLTRLAETFPQAKISQIYGATEMGQNITVKDGKPGLPLSVLDEGGDVVFKIVDGELWVRSRSSMLGYVDQPPVPDGAWRATGDLVEVVDDRIMFRGRRTEVINVGGVKVHPLPIEELVSSIEGVQLVHAFGRPNPVVGHIVALEVVPASGVDEDVLRGEIRRACAALPPAARPRSITFVGTVETSGNKVSRGARPAPQVASPGAELTSR